MSTEVAVMQKPLKAEVQSPVKPEVLKPSNTANLQNITNISAKIAANNKAPNFTNKITSNAITKSSDSFTGKHVLGRVNIRIQPITSKPNVIRSPYHQSTKSPFKPLTPIRPSPTPKSSLTSPICATTPTSPIRTPTSATKGLDSSSLSASFNTLLASPSSSSTISLSPTKCRRRISYSDTEVRIPVSRRNARERNRVKQVSQGFAILRQHVPQASRKKKLSKVETLRCAVDYIRGLQLLLDDHTSTTQQPLTTTTPSHLHHHHLHHHHHHHHQQQQQLQHQHPHQVFLQPHPAIEPHILKLPVSDETFQSPASLRYDGVAGAFLRTSPTDSEGGQSPAHVFYSDKLSSSSTTSPSSSSSSSSSSSMGVSVGAIKTEGNEARNYGREEQDLLDALAWWQHNIQP